MSNQQRTRDDPLTKLRRLCLALPETTELLSHGEPTWFVGDKRVFVMLADHHHDDRGLLACLLARRAARRPAHPGRVGA